MSLGGCHHPNLILFWSFGATNFFETAPFARPVGATSKARTSASAGGQGGFGAGDAARASLMLDGEIKGGLGGVSVPPRGLLVKSRLKARSAWTRNLYFG